MKTSCHLNLQQTLASQQFLALALQEGSFGASDWPRWWGDLALMADGAEVGLTYLREKDFLVEDSGLLMIGPRAEKEFGRRHFIDLLSTFVAADLELRVVAGVREIGFVSPLALPAKAEYMGIEAAGTRRVEDGSSDISIGSVSRFGLKRFPQKAM